MERFHVCACTLAFTCNACWPFLLGRSGMPDAHKQTPCHALLLRAVHRCCLAGLVKVQQPQQSAQLRAAASKYNAVTRMQTARAKSTSVGRTIRAHLGILPFQSSRHLQQGYIGDIAACSCILVGQRKLPICCVAATPSRRNT